MRKFLMVAAVGALALLMAVPASAVDFKFSGEYRVRLYTAVNQGFDNSTATNPRGAQIRVRPRFDASDDNGNIQSVLRLEIGDVEFGNGGGAAGNTYGTAAGGGTGTYRILGQATQGSRVGNGAGGAGGADGVNIETKWAFIDFALPLGAPGRVRAGLQSWYLPKGILVDDDAAGIRIYGTKIANMLNYDLFWYRVQGGYQAAAAVAAPGVSLVSTSNTLDNNYDFFGAKVDVALSPIFNPGLYYIWGLNKSGDLTTGAAAGGVTDSARNSHYFGLTVTGKVGVVSYDFDAIYGFAEGGPNGTFTVGGVAGAEPIDVKGFALDAHMAFPVGPLTVNLAGAYASGDKRNGGSSEAFPAIMPSWNGAGGGYELIGSGGPFDATEFTQDYLTNLWMIGLWLEYRPVKALWTKLAWGYMGLANRNGNCATAAAGTCWGPSYFGKGGTAAGGGMTNASKIGHELSLRADYDLWTNFKLQGQLGWLFPSSGGSVAHEYVLQMLYNF
jgi:hypothetical protein